MTTTKNDLITFEITGAHLADEIFKALPDTKIRAIVALRALTGLSLKDSKELIDAAAYRTVVARASTRDDWLEILAHAGRCGNLDLAQSAINVLRGLNCTE